MFTTPEYYLSTEVAYRRERIAREWGSANRRRRSLRLPKSRTLRLPERQPGGVAVA